MYSTGKYACTVHVRQTRRSKKRKTRPPHDPHSKTTKQLETLDLAAHTMSLVWAHADMGAESWALLPAQETGSVEISAQYLPMMYVDCCVRAKPRPWNDNENIKSKIGVTTLAFRVS